MVETKDPVICRVGARIEVSVGRRVARYLPGVRLARQEGYRCWARTSKKTVAETLQGRYESVGIDVSLAVRQFGALVGRFDQPPPPLITLASAHAGGGGLEVEVRATGRAGTAAPYRRIRQLAEDLSTNAAL
jgi:hypothetical protein